MRETNVEAKEQTHKHKKKKRNRVCRQKNMATNIADITNIGKKIEMCLEQIADSLIQGK